MLYTLPIADTLPPSYIALAIGVVAVFGYALPIWLVFLAVTGRYKFASVIALVELLILTVLFRGVVDLPVHPSVREVVLLLVLIGMPFLIYVTGVALLTLALFRQMTRSKRNEGPRRTRP